MNMQALLKQAQKMQKEITKAEEELKNKEYETTMGGGALKISVAGNMEIKSIDIDKTLLNEEGKEDLEEMLKSAINEALAIAAEEKDKVMSGLTGGVKMPGGF